MKGIDKRISQDGSISYRARVRIKGHPPVIKTFNSLTIAKKWKKDAEVDIEKGRYFDTIESQKHTLSEAIHRYIKSILPGKPIDFKKGEIKIFPTPSLNTYGRLIQVSSTDLRATMAIILYAIHNNICCKIDQFNLIYRGYTDVHDKIQSIGGKLEYQSNYADSFSQIQ